MVGVSSRIGITRGRDIRTHIEVSGLCLRKAEEESSCREKHEVHERQ